MINRLASLAIASAVLFGANLTAFAADRPLLFHAEAGSEHRVVWSEGADQSFNPASVIKVATSLLALNTLGADHRYETDFGCSGECSIEDGVLQGDLVIVGDADPDFQAENAWLVAHELSKLGISAVAGDLIVDGVFFQGWEHGVEKRQNNEAIRARLMGGRFQKALDVTQWDQIHFASWEDAAPRHAWPLNSKPRIVIEGSIRMRESMCGVLKPLVRHRSNPLALTLKRFNTFSNNDIVRVADPIGGPEAIEMLLEVISDGLPGDVQVATASGERVNRLTARQVIKMLWVFREACRELGLEVEDILPVPGCVPGSLPRMFPRLADGESTRTAVVKSGTLTTTDGGVAVLAGFFRSLEGETVAFCVAAPRAGGQLKRMRLKEQDWLLDLMGSVGGAAQRICGISIPFSDTMAEARVTRQSGTNTTHGETNAAK